MYNDIIVLDELLVFELEKKTANCLAGRESPIFINKIKEDVLEFRKNKFSIYSGGGANPYCDWLRGLIEK